MSRRIAVLTLALCAALPAAAQAAPTSTPHPYRDRVQARAAQAGNTSISVPLTEGGAIQVSFTPAVGTQPDLAQQYVAFLESLPHGSELGDLKLLIATPDEVNSDCGGTGDGDGEVLGCYGKNEMIVPSTGLDTPTAVGSYTVRYVLTHEYGHHIAAHRKNEMGNGLGALDNGPTYWAFYELVCEKTAENKLFPTAETNFDQYLRNPGEAWAETYARLVYPDQPWTWTSLLKPDAGALAAARKDVLDPWTKNVTKTFTMKAGRNAQAFDVTLTLDGTLKASATGPKGSHVTVKLTSDGSKVPMQHGANTHTWSLAGGCREKQDDTATFHVQRQGGTPGPVTLKVTYAG